MSEQTVKQNGVQVDFICQQDGCGETVKFNLLDCLGDDFQVVCPKCHHAYAFGKELQDKMKKLTNLVVALREAGPILGDCSIAVAVPGGEVKVPYALLLTRLNTLISLPLGDKKVDFRLLVEPSAQGAFK